MLKSVTEGNIATEGEIGYVSEEKE